MKRLLFLLIAMLPLVVSYAQLGAPTITVRDTFQIVRIDYNKTALAEQDWPCSYLVEDPIYVDVAGFNYRKDGEPYLYIDRHESGFGYLDSYSYNVVCNSKKSKLEKWVFRKGDYYARFSIDGYDFYVVKPSSAMGSCNMVTGKTNGAYSLSGRSVQALPCPSTATQKSGKIVVRVFVDRSGNVVNVLAPEKGSTISDASLVELVKAAAMKAKFSTSESAPEIQIGTITYTFRNN